MTIRLQRTAVILDGLALGIISLLSFLVFLPDAASATYKWRDANGTVHLSDDPTDMPSLHPKNYQVIPDSPPPRGGLNIPFEKTTTGLILVETMLNDDLPARMILDTGADTVVITEELARKLNQDLIMGDEEIRIETNCGIVKGRSFLIGKIKLGDITKENVRSIITPQNFSLNGFDGLLGISFLADFKVTVDYQNKKIIVDK